MYSKELFSHLKDRYFLEQLQKFKSFFAVGFPPGYGKKKNKKNVELAESLLHVLSKVRLP